jgi:uncharacterized protein with PIN domain
MTINIKNSKADRLVQELGELTGENVTEKLNFGDCFAYALSKTSGEPLLFKGDDFSQTDITAVI